MPDSLASRPSAMLAVSGHDVPSDQFPLDPKGVVLGRSPECTVVLDSASVSRHHARLYQDPFGRWIVEDLGSRNGVWVDGERVRASSVLPGDKFALGKVVLSIQQPSQRDIPVHMTGGSATTDIIDEGSDAIRLAEARAEEALSRARLKEFNTIVDRLAEVPSPSELYTTVCRCLAETPNTAAVVVRLPAAPRPLPSAPQTLAAHFGGQREDDGEPDVRNLHLSRRVLEAVRQSGDAATGSNNELAEGGLGLTVTDRKMPRTVYCCPIASTGEWTDALYLTVPSVLAGDDVLDYVRAVARQTNFARKSLLQAEEKSERLVLEEQLSWARDIQTKLTPEKLDGIAGIDLAVCYEPAMWVGGDYCDMWRLPDDRLAFAVGDVSGKGLPAAMVMANLQAALRATMSFCATPADVMQHLNRHLGDNLPEGMFVTFFLGLLDPAGGRLEYVNAGHLPAFRVLSGGGASVVCKATAPPLGTIEGPFETSEEQVGPGTGLVLVTDGITEASAPDETFFGLEGVENLLAAGGRSAQETVQALAGAVSDLRQHLAQQDDITVFALFRQDTAA